MEIDLEGQVTSIPTRRRGSGVARAYFHGRIYEEVGYWILEALIRVIKFTVPACYLMASLIGRGWRKVRPLIFMVALKWERAFVLSCIAVSLDPLFLYIPIVDETNKCLAMDKNLKPIALFLRSLTDFLLITHIIAQICNWVDTDYPKYSCEDTEHCHDLDPEFYPAPEALNRVEKLAKHKLLWSIIIKFLAVLPVPQVGILVGFFRMRGSDFLVNRKFLNVSLVLQYLPRVCQIYLIKSEFRMPGKWVDPSFNLFLYILASHVLGALWYFCAIERETSCWYKACRQTQGCVVGSYNCSGSAKNITLLDQLCPINSPNSTVFDFGMFVKILQSGNTGSGKFVTKLFYSLWWGLKNLSNFGTNLETSSYMWENCFAILICVIGLLLFLYLIGNVQLYIQSSTQKSLDKEQKRTVRIQQKKADITKWMTNKFLPGDVELRKRIKSHIREDKVVENNLRHEVDVLYFLQTDPSVVTSRIRKSISDHLGMAALKKMLGNIMDDTQLKSLCQLMEPVVYNKTSNVVRREDPLDKMLFVIEGELESTDPPPIMTVKQNESYGQDIILEWALLNYTTRFYYVDVPLSTRSVKAGEAKVEALGLDAWELLHFIEEKKVDINSPIVKGYLANSASKTDQVDTEDQLSPDSTVQWNPPDSGWVKLNCASLWDPESKTARLGGILGDNGGALIEAGLSYFQPCIDKFEAAAYSIKNYIKFHPRFASTKTTKIVVESDDKLLVECLERWSSLPKERVRRRLLPILEKIMMVASRFERCTFVHCERQTNAAAILLAKHAMPTHGSSKTWKAHENIPQWLATVLKEDSPPPKVPNQEPVPKEQIQQPVAKVQKQEPVPKEQNQVSISKEQNQELVAKDSEAAPDELKTAKQPLALLLKNI